MKSKIGYGVSKIERTSNNLYAKVLLNKRGISERLEFKDCEDKLSPYSFLVGQSVNGIITQNIIDLPHLIVAGTTGGGKSYFLRQALLGLLQSTSNIQMYLLDMKNGIEFESFSLLPNVISGSKVPDCLNVIRKIHKEMHRRFELSKQKKRGIIDLEKDKLDLILLAIDESSFLIRSDGKNDPFHFQKTEARRLVDDISKLGRAAKVHLILGMQRVTKTSVSTETQENITGRVCFKMNTLQGSNIVLGNKMALDLKHIKGRAIWNIGSLYEEIQAPLLQANELEEKLSIILSEYESGHRKINGKMLLEKIEKTRGGSVYLKNKKS